MALPSVAKIMAAELRVNHAQATAAGVAKLMDDDLTSDVTFIVTEEIGDAAGSQDTTLQRSTADVGTGKAGRSPAVVLDADFGDEAESGYGGGSAASQTALTAGRATRRAAAVAGDYAAAMRADAALGQSFAPPTFEFKAHRALFAAASDFFRERLYRPTALAASGKWEASVKLSPAVTASAFASIRQYVYTGQLTVTMDDAVELVAACAVCGLEELLRAVVGYAVSALSLSNLFPILLAADRFVTHRQTVGEACAQQCNTLLDACEAFFCEHARELVMDEEFLHLPTHLLESLAQRDDLAILELDWFEAINRWVDADRRGRESKQPCCCRPDTSCPTGPLCSLPYLVCGCLCHLQNAEQSLVLHRAGRGADFHHSLAADSPAHRARHHEGRQALRHRRL